MDWPQSKLHYSRSLQFFKKGFNIIQMDEFMSADCAFVFIRFSAFSQNILSCFLQHLKEDCCITLLCATKLARNPCLATLHAKERVHYTQKYSVPHRGLFNVWVDVGFLDNERNSPSKIKIQCSIQMLKNKTFPKKQPHTLHKELLQQKLHMLILNSVTWK